MAAVLGVELGGPLRYGARVEQRPRLGEGPRPAASDIDRSIAVVQRAQWLLAGCLAGAALFDALWAGRSDPRQATPAAR